MEKAKENNGAGTEVTKTMFQKIKEIKESTKLTNSEKAEAVNRLLEGSFEAAATNEYESTHKAKTAKRNAEIQAVFVAHPGIAFTHKTIIAKVANGNRKAYFNYDPITGIPETTEEGLPVCSGEYSKMDKGVRGKLLKRAVNPFTEATGMNIIFDEAQSTFTYVPEEPKK